MPSEVLHEPRTGYDLYDTGGGLIQLSVDTGTAAATLAIDAAELLWAIDEFGRCQTEELILVPAGHLP